MMIGFQLLFFRSIIVDFAGIFTKVSFYQIIARMLLVEPKKRHIFQMKIGKTKRKMPNNCGNDHK